MPRRNKTLKHTPFDFVNPESNKRKYASENAALKAAETAMLQKPNLILSVYQGTDGGWYLTRNAKI
jgi:hypothetical protein